MTNRPTDEEFHAMNDAAFTAWWDAYVEAAQAQATSEDEVQAAVEEMHAAWDQRWGNDRADS